MNRKKLQQFKTEGNIEAIKGLMKANHGYVTSKMLTELGIHRMYLNIMISKGQIERVNKGVYMDKTVIEDVYYSFQLRYPKVLFSRFTALYFYGLTEVYPSNFDITVDYNYHVDAVNKKHTVMKCNKEILELGAVEVKTPFGNKVKAYDKERCICDIIKYKNRLDMEQVKKTVKMYMKGKNKNLNKLAEYSKKMGIHEIVMEYAGMFDE